MPGSLSLVVGTNTATIPLAGTNAKINSAILRFLAYKGVQTEGLTATQIGEALLAELKKIVVDVSKEMQRAELENANSAAIETTVIADNSL